MLEIKLHLEDDSLYAALESSAAKYGCSVQEIVREAVKQWLIDTEMDELEMDEVEAASRDWWENGGSEAGEFIEGLKEEKKA